MVFRFPVINPGAARSWASTRRGSRLVPQLSLGQVTCLQLLMSVWQGLSARCGGYHLKVYGCAVPLSVSVLASDLNPLCLRDQGLIIG